MSETLYKELITKTFRDNAIRSVMMIDDEYLRYDELLNQLEAGQNDKADPRISVTKKAASLHDFFRKEKISCDIDNGVASIDPDKIRKSDLVILDYELEKDDPRKSIHLIGQLQKNDHMNLVVLYTRAKPNEVWIRLAASLSNAKTLGSIATSLGLDSQKLQSDWDEVTDSTDEPPNEWSDWMTDEDLSKYVLTNDVGDTAKSKFDKTYKNNGKPFRQYACEKRLKEQNDNIIATSVHGFDVRGSSDSVKWLQSGNVFVVIHSKSTGENPNEPQELWDALTAGLVDWNPSYYQLLISEVQNTLENEGLAFDLSFSNNVEGQAAWLSKILETVDVVNQDNLSSQLIHQLVDDLKIKLSNKTELQNFQSQSIGALSVIKQSKPDHNFEKFSALHVKMDISSNDFDQRMLHALNANLCSNAFTGKYVTNGTLLKQVSGDDEEPNWYLCVSPACDTVPVQVKGQLARRLNPDRLLKLLVLTKTDLKGALKNATSGKNIFVYYENKERLAFIAQNNHGSPEIEYALIHNHNNPNVNIRNVGVSASFLGRDPGKNASHLKEAKLIPFSQLRDSYTARYQTVASHHLGRVGVDYFDSKKPAA